MALFRFIDYTPCPPASKPRRRRNSPERLKPNVIIFSVTTAGYVLVGGKSSRMGRDKALLPFRGGVLAQSVARAVILAAGSVTLAGNPARYAHLGYRVIPDLYPGEGPLGGLLTALHDTQSDWNLITACDLPNLEPNFLSNIVDAARHSTADALLPEGPAGLEPLCAVYHCRSLAGLEAAFTRGVRKIKDALPDISLVALPAVDLTPLRNANTPEEWSRHAGFEPVSFPPFGSEAREGRGYEAREFNERKRT